MVLPKPKIFMVVNPEAGGGLARKLWPRVSDALHKQVGRFDFKETAAQGDGRRIACDAVRKGYTTIVACGGDGTIHEVVNGLNDAGVLGAKKKSVRLGIISMGTGGDLIKTLRFPKDWKRQVKLLSRPGGARRCHTSAIGPNRTKRIDLGKITYTNASGRKESCLFINIADAGLGANVVSRMKTTRGLFGKKLAYITATLRSYMAWKSCRITMTTDDGERQTLTPLSLIVANGKYFGGGMPIAPMADLSDGYFDLVVIHKANPLLSLVTAPLLYLKQHMRLPHVRMARAKKVMLASESRIGLDIDGEPIGFLPAIFEIQPNSLEVIAPC